MSSSTMKISPVNPVVHQSIKRYLTKDLYSQEQFYDYDNCCYFIYREEENPDIIKFGFACNASKQIMENGGQEMLDELYKDCQLDKSQWLEHCDITLKIDASGLERTQKVKKTMSDEEAQKIRDSNDEIRRNREEKAEEIAKRFSVFKRDFMSAPIRRAMNAILAGKGDSIKPCQIDYRKKERYWVMCGKQAVDIVFEINFETKTDTSLARIFLLELQDCKRDVKNAPVVLYHDKTNPATVEKNFPGAMKQRTSNGSITLSVNESHIKKGIDQPLSQLIGFRQYMHFHMHAIKISLHTKMRKRVQNMELIIKQARRDEEAPKTFKEKHGGEQITEAQEEKKNDQVYKFR